VKPAQHSRGRGVLVNRYRCPSDGAGDEVAWSRWRCGCLAALRTARQLRGRLLHRGIAAVTVESVLSASCSGTEGVASPGSSEDSAVESIPSAAESSTGGGDRTDAVRRASCVIDAPVRRGPRGVLQRDAGRRRG